MKIAICSLSSFTHVAEFLDAAQWLGDAHEIRYFPGFRTAAAEQLLEGRGMPAVYTFAADNDANRLVPLQEANDTDQAFGDYFFRHAALALPGLIRALRGWQPDWVFSHLRDFAGITAAEYLGIPFASFGSHQSPARVEPVDPPFGAGQPRQADGRRIALAWRHHHRFNERMDAVFNARVRRPLGLPDVHGASTLHSTRLTLLTLPSFFSNKSSNEPSYVHFIGPQFCRRACAPDETELRLFDRIRHSPRPRLLIAAGSTYGGRLMPVLLEALTRFEGSIVIAAEPSTLPPGERSAHNVVCARFFCDMNSLHELVDLVVITGAGKSATDALRQGRPMLCIPCQGEQMENSFALESLGAAKICGRRDEMDIRKQVSALLDDASYRSAARLLGERMKAERSGAAEMILSCIKDRADVTALE